MTRKNKNTKKKNEKKDEISQPSLEQALNEHEIVVPIVLDSPPDMQEAYAHVLGRGLNNLLTAFDHVSLEEGFAGMKSLETSLAEVISTTWANILHTKKQQGSFQGETPQGFLVRFLPDGSLLMKAVEMPKGVVFTRHQTSSYAPSAPLPKSPPPAPVAPRAIPSVQEELPPAKESASPSEIQSQPKPVKTLSFDSSGKVVVKES